MKQKTLLLALIAAFALYSMQSCKSIRELAYFQATDSLKFKQIPRIQPAVARIQPNDILAITVSSMDQKTNDILNFATVNRLTTSFYAGLPGAATGAGQPLGYLVDAQGFVEVPFVGKINVNDRTLSEAADVVRKLVDSSLVADPAVNVRFLNHKFSVLGEVSRPATFTLLDDRTTLPQALSMAGDIGVYGNRENVMVVREGQGTQEIARLNLTNEEIFDSPFYYVRNGDLIYIEPLPEKATNTDRRVQLAPIWLSAISTTIVLLTFIANSFK